MMNKWLKSQVLIPLILTCGFITVSYAIVSSPPQSKRKTPEYIEPVVEVITSTNASYDVNIKAQGLIKPAQKQVNLASLVSGKVVSVHRNFIPGGFIPAGETILQIETADYELALKDAEAKTAVAQASLVLEKGQQRLAKKQLELSKSTYSIDGNNDALALALRKPQLKQAKAEFALTQNDVEKARLALERTRLTLPFDALVLEANSTNGEAITQGNTAGVFARANKYWLELKVQQKHLHRLHARTLTRNGSLVSFKANGYRYRGEVISLRTNLVSTTRMGGVIVEVVKPFSSNHPSLIIDSHVSATVQAGTIKNALKLPRNALINDQQIFVVDSANKLQVRDIKIQWEMNDNTIVQASLAPDDRVVVSRIFGIAPGSIVNPVNAQ